MTLIHALLFILVSGIVILAVLLVKKIKDLRMPPEETDDRLSERVRELIQEAAKEDAASTPEKKLDFDE
jgi:hypothetical protein